jgi:hypothetical protein
MTPHQIARYNALTKRMEQLMNFIYVSDFTIFVTNGILLDAAVELAKKNINEIDFEISNL